VCVTGLIGLAVLVGFAAPASALAATVTVTSPCVVNTVDGPEGAGFSPGSTLTISTDGNLAAQAQSDASGALHFVLRTPVGVVRAHQTVQLTVTDPAGVAAQTSYDAVVQSVLIPRHTKAGRPATFRAYGFPGPAPVHLFWFFHGVGSHETTLGIGKGPCGIVPPAQRQILKPQDRDGIWRIAEVQGDANEILYELRVRKRGTRISYLGID
jgi:hypothetical protein